MAGPRAGETETLCEILLELRRRVVHRIIIARSRDPERVGDEITALNDIDEAIRNNCV